MIKENIAYTSFVLILGGMLLFTFTVGSQERLEQRMKERANYYKQRNCDIKFNRCNSYECRLEVWDKCYNE